MPTPCDDAYVWVNSTIRIGWSFGPRFCVTAACKAPWCARGQVSIGACRQFTNETGESSHLARIPSRGRREDEVVSNRAIGSRRHRKLHQYVHLRRAATVGPGRTDVSEQRGRHACSGHQRCRRCQRKEHTATQASSCRDTATNLNDSRAVTQVS